MPVVANATIQVTPVLEGAQKSLTDQMVGAAGPAGEAAGKEGGKKLGGSLAKGLAVGTAAVGAAVGAAGAAMLGAAGATAEYGDQIDKASQKLGVSSTFYQEWEAVLQHSGTSMDSMGASFKKLATASQDATDDQIAAFKALGLSMGQVKSMSAEDLFQSVVTGLQGMEDSTKRTALATTLLGKGAQELGPLLNTSAEDTQKMIDTVNELGGVMSEDSVKAAAAYQDAMQDMQTAMGGVKNDVISALLPVMTDLFNGISSFIANTDLTPLTDTLGKAVGALGKFISGLDIEAIGNTFQNVVSAVGEVVETVWGVLEGIFESVGTAIETITTAVTDDGMTWDETWSGISELMTGVGETINAVIEAIGQIIAWLINQVQTDGTYFNLVWKNMMTIVETAQKVIKGVVDVISKLLAGDWAGAWEAAKGVVDDMLGGIKTICEDTWNYIKETATTIWEGIKDAITGPIQAAKDKVDEVIGNIKDLFPLKIGKIFDGIKIPKINISGGKAPWGIAGMGEAPEISIGWKEIWNARAMMAPYMFQGATLFGAGEAGDEILYGRDALMRDIREATGGGVTFNVNVNGADNPEVWAARFMREAQQYARIS